MTLITAPLAPLASDVLPAAMPLPGLEPLRSVRPRWPTLLAALLTIAMAAGLAHQLFHRGLAGLTRSTPTDPRFWLCFAAFYMSLPVGDWLIFRKLWGIPASGLAALLKKRIANDVLVNYTGEAYFYAWARARATLVAAPFGAIKDVSILSAIAGNALTLAMLVIALPLGRGLLTPAQFREGLWSTVLLVAISLPFLLFSRRVFSLPPRTLWAVFALQCARVVASSTFTALAWHFALPAVSVGMWLFLAAGRLLVSRLPLAPNKELLFFTFATLLIGQHDRLIQLLAFFAGLTLAINAALILVFVGHGLATRRKWW
ncbi:hypothetical protein [uncultured Sphingomonas sp.]|uniref:hypothetical protein n=1 Tax=uncultured Sphingomonas sp. TaxID=158754 RepID=UPI0035CA6659